uniref:Uncharacterized protein n=1 Tax=Fagus sylvatica TaxID=28930 RepID=A0A2N9FHZ1_FAGSY
MEDEKKKKRNKKKKNKQNKATEDVAAGEPDSSLDQNNHESNGQDDHIHGQVQVSETVHAHNVDVPNVNMDLNGHLLNGTGESSISVEAEKQQWLEREATLEESIKQLQSEKDLHLKKEGSLEEIVKVLQNENELHMKKEAGLEEKISQLLDEKANLSSKGASLEEKVKHLERENKFWISNENSTKETIANLNGDVAKLQAQVMELEEFRNNLLQENQRLMEITSGLQSQIQNLERSISSTSSSDELKKRASEIEDLNSQMEAACALIEKLITENAELVEKCNATQLPITLLLDRIRLVNELYVELDRQSPTAGLPSATGSDQMAETAKTASVANPLSEPNENLSVTGKKLESVEIVPIQVETIGADNVDVEQDSVIPNALISEEPGEIVQISLDENEIRDFGMQAGNDDEKTPVQFSDAPLIGAPFRLISFVATYVSGGDLVNKNSSR